MGIYDPLPKLPLWIEYGRGRHIMTLPLHQIADHLGSSARGLQYLYAINGCDTVSSFRGIGKRTAFHISKHFEFLAQLSNVNYSSFNLHIVESFVCRLFDRKSDICDINQP